MITSGFISDFLVLHSVMARAREYNRVHAHPLSRHLSPFSRKVRIVLAEKNLEFTLKFEKTWERRPEFLALNPAGEVPVLIEPDGTVIAGTEAIVEYLDEVYPREIG